MHGFSLRHRSDKRKSGRSAPGTLDVRLIRPSATRGRLTGGGLDVACAVGRSGVRALKREGDGASPRGSHAILFGFYRPDRLRIRPRSSIALRPLRPDDGWCDAPGHPDYNRLVRRPFAFGHEALWRDDELYDIVLVLDWNYSRRARGRGSAIFFHLSRPGYQPTEGCVAIGRADMLRLLARIGRGTRLRLGVSPRPMGRIAG